MYWYSPFFLADNLLTKLKNSGFVEIKNTELKEGKKVILIYDTPDQIFNNIVKTNEVDSLELELILKNYEEILSIKRKTNFPLINASQLQNIAKSHLIELSKDLKLFDEKIFNKKLKFNFNHNLISIIILKCIENSPNIFNSYLDCELNSTLMGREPDVNYLERINNLFKEAFLLIILNL